MTERYMYGKNLPVCLGLKAFDQPGVCVITVKSNVFRNGAVVNGLRFINQKRDTCEALLSITFTLPH